MTSTFNRASCLAIMSFSRLPRRVPAACSPSLKVVSNMKEGAQEYIVKPCNPEEISLLVNRIIKVKNLQRENTILRKKLTRQYSVHDVISKNPRMQEIMALCGEIAS